MKLSKKTRIALSILTFAVTYNSFLDKAHAAPDRPSAAVSIEIRAEPILPTSLPGLHETLVLQFYRALAAWPPAEHPLTKPLSEGP